MKAIKREVKARWEILLLLLLPFLLLLINQIWIFHPNGAIDPWVYSGYFIRLKQYLIAFPDAYYGSRLSWILPGYLAYSLFPPLVANYVLHLGFYYLATLSLYLILQPSVGRRAAFLASAAMGSYTFFLLAMGWDYVDGAGITYFLLTVLMLSWAARKERWALWMGLTGVFFGALIYTNLIWLVFAPPLLIYYILTNRPHQRGKTLIKIAAFVGGILAITLVLGSISYAIGGKFFFFMPSVSVVLGNTGKPNPWRIDWREWLPEATWLILPLVVVLGSTASLVLSQVRKLFAPSDVVPLQAIFIVSCLSMIVLEATAFPILQFPFYATYLIPPLFLAMGVPLKSLRGLSNGSFVSVATFALILIVFSLVSAYVPDDRLILVSDDQPIALSLLFLAALLFSVASDFNQKKVGSILAIALLTISASFSFAQGWTINQSVKQLQANAVSSKAAIDSHLTVSTVQKLFREIDPTVSVFFWYSLKELEVYRSISSATLWGYRFINEDFPSLQPYGVSASEPLSPERLSGLKTQFTASPKIAIFSQQEDALQQAINSLKTVGFTAKSIATYPIKQDTIAFTITIIEVSKLKGAL
ncbi:glycosyltransferase family 39 protein [Leptolyngbyaceae cyanobacterium UHCC 1019]